MPFQLCPENYFGFSKSPCFNFKRESLPFLVGGINFFKLAFITGKRNLRRLFMSQVTMGPNSYNKLDKKLKA